MSLLSPLLANTLSSSQPPFILVTDSLLQPALLLLREFISTSLSRNEQVILVFTEQSPSKLLPSSYDHAKVEVLDAFATAPHASTSALADGSSALADGSIDMKALEKNLLEMVKARRRSGNVLVVLDSVDMLAESGMPALVSLLRKVFKASNASSGFRVLALHHAFFPSPPSTSSALSAAILPTLLSPNISSSTVHLTLHPSRLLELLSRDYGLYIPLNPSLTPDLRLHAFLTSFTSRLYGSPFVRPESSEQQDERIPLDLGGKKDGGCVLEWSARGVTIPGDSGVKRGESKKIVTRGFEGLQRTMTGVSAVHLNKVLREEELATVVLPEAAVVNTNTSAKPTDPPLPFTLSLTDSQKAAREEVVLPYLPKEPVAGGGIEYVPDAGDDMDDDDPDEDLEW